MLYELYEKKILKIRQIKTTIRKYRVLIIVASCLLFLSVCSFLYFKGMIVSDVGEIGSVVYGEEPKFDAGVFCGKAEYEYSNDGESWTSVAPYLPGIYNVRAVSKRTFGIKETGTSASFEIVKKSVNVLYPNTTATYGDNVDISAELAYNDRIVGYETLYDNEGLGETTARIDKASLTVENDKGEKVTEAYEFIIAECNVTIVPRPITITSGSESKTYDGKPLICHSFDCSDGSLVKNDNAVVTYGSSITDSGSTDNTFTVRIENGEGIDVTENYSITCDYGKLIVSKREITVYPEDCEKIYDGERFTSAVCALSSDSPFELVLGHSVIIDTEADSPDVDASINTIIKCAVFDGDINVTENYAVAFKTGKVTINKRPIIIYPDDYEKVYDGTTFTEAHCVLSSDSPYDIVVGHNVEIETQAKGADVNTTENQIIRYNITDGEKDVTKNYSVTAINGALTINKREIKIIPVYKEKIYDGNALTCSEVVLRNSSNELVDGHTVKAETDGTITDVGREENNVISSTILAENGTDVTENYYILSEVGTLIIKKRNVYITAGSATKTYDKTPLTCGAIEIDNLLSKHRIEGTIATEGTITFAGSTFNILSCSDIGIVDENNVEVTNNYNVIKKNGTLTVQPKSIRVSFFEKEKEYDGTEFSIPSATDFWWSDGNKRLLDGDTLTFEEIYFTSQQGSRVENPHSAGIYSIKAYVKIMNENSEDVSACYNVEYSGEMVIKKRVMKFTVDCYKGEYNFSDLRCIYNSELPAGHTMQCEVTSDDIRKVVKGIKVISPVGEVTENFDFIFIQNDLSV